ncbi:amino acid adenylation domain-containing protein [Kitasatospora sp. NPDC094011]|uniref:non-ribosomal peptide synthetase n=1 Tax=Kitasatospora sp. NPDC094011 TaxID=3364090 RepID=UPI0037F10979
MEEEGTAAVSSAQRRAWLQAQFSLGDTANQPLAWRLSGQLDVPLLASAFGVLIERHEVLRTGFVAETGEPRQVLGAPYAVDLTPVRVDGLDQSEREAQIRTLVENLVRAPFDLSAPSMLRAGLFEVAAHEHVLVAVIPHIAVDDWSAGILQRELSSVYGSLRNGRKPALPEPAMQYRDYARWEADLLAGGALREGLEYWQRQLAEIPASLQLPTDRHRPGTAFYRRGCVQLVLDHSVERRVSGFASRCGTTAFTVYLAAYQLLLSLWAGQNDVVTAVPIANRLLPETEELIGFFANTAPLRLRVDQEAAFTDLVAEAAVAAQEAFDYQEVPFDRVLEALRRPGSASAAALVQVALVGQRDREDMLVLDGLEVTPYAVGEPTTQFELVTALAPAAGGLQLSAAYAADLFDESTIRCFLEQFANLLDTVLEHPGVPLRRLELLRAEPLTPPAVLPAPGRGVLETIWDQAASRPGACAVDHLGGTWTYAELAAQARRAVSALRGAGVRPGEVVGLQLAHSAEQIAAVLAVWHLGAAFVALDPVAPSERTASMIADAGVGVVVIHGSARDAAAGWGAVVVDSGQLFGEAVDDSDPVPWSGQRLAYLVYTSGTAGTPKAVEVEHEGLAHLARAVGALMGPPGARALNVMAPVFDGWIWSGLLPLAHGMTVVLREGVQVAAGLLDAPVDLVTCTPSLLAAAGDVLRDTRTVIVAGEPCPAALARQWSSRGRLVNAYGPTEATICAAWADSARGDDTTTIGRPLAHVAARVVDAYGRLLPAGVPGELLLGGPAVARGYRNRPALTAERFVSPTGDGARSYRTGDLVRWRGDGQLEFLGRLDEQIKVRGFRIEPSEIESAALDVEHVAEAAAFATADRTALALAAVAPRTSFERLRAHLDRVLPDYLRPDLVLLVETMPRTAVGKLDRAALAHQVGHQVPQDAQGGGRAPAAGTEQRLAEQWSALLDQPVTSAEANFFDLGGHSLLAAKLLGRLRRQWGVRLEVADLLDHPVLADLAALIDKAAP